MSRVHPNYPCKIYYYDFLALVDVVAIHMSWRVDTLIHYARAILNYNSLSLLIVMHLNGLLHWYQLLTESGSA